MSQKMVRHQEVGGRNSRVTDDDGTHVRVVCDRLVTIQGWHAAELILASTCRSPGRSRLLPVETTRHAFAYLRGRSSNVGPRARRRKASAGWIAPAQKRDNRSLGLRRGDEVTVHVRRWDPFRSFREARAAGPS